VVSKRTFEQSPSNSPHKIGKTGPKRPRTVVVRQLTSSLVKDTNSSVTQLQYAQILTMEDFEENREGNEQLLISHKLFSYIALNYVTHRCQDFNCVLCDLGSILGNNDGMKIQPSQIYYMELSE